MVVNLFLFNLQHNWMHKVKTKHQSFARYPDVTIHWQNPSGRTMSLGSTQPLTEMSTRNIFWEVKAVGA